MKKNIFILMFIVLFLTSCFNKGNETLVSTGALDSTGSLNNTGVIDNTSTGKLVEVEKYLSIEEKIALLISEQDILKKLGDKKSGDFLEELPRIKSYYSNTPFYEFYILNSIKTSDVNECEKIVLEDKKILCKEIYDNYKDEKKLINIYSKYGEKEDFSKKMFKIFKNIESKNETCESDSIIQYLSCKKIFNKDFDAEKVYINYSRLELSKMYIVKKYYKEIIENWGMDKGFSQLIEKISIDTGNTSEKK